MLHGQCNRCARITWLEDNWCCSKCKQLLNSKKGEYCITLTQEEIDAIPILFNMAEIYSWELFYKNENSKYYKQHKENIDSLNKYHAKGYQGILAVANIIKDKINNLKEN